MRLLAAEFRRFFARDIVRIMAFIILAGAILTGVGSFVAHAQVSPEQAESDDLLLRRLSQSLPERIEACANPPPFDPSIYPEDTPPDVLEFERQRLEQERSYEECREEAVLNAARQGLVPQLRLRFAAAFPEALRGFFVPLAVMALVTGASIIGAEWSSGGMTTLLTWEPRRLRILGARMTHLVLGIVAAYSLAALLIAGALMPAALTRGTFVGIGGLWWETTLLLGLRGLAAALLGGLLGFALALTIRNTVAAVGTVVAWLALERVLVGFTQSLNGWLLSTNLLVWQQGHSDSPGGDPIIEGGTAMGSLGLLVVWAGGLLILAILLFWRRDIHASGD